MPTFETIFFFAVFVLLALAGLTLLVVLRERGSSAATVHYEAGEFQEALDAATAVERPSRDDLLAGARSARHLGDLATSERLIRRLIAADSEDGEAWLEVALTAAYARDADKARQAFDRVPASRSDLLESLTLHRAWLELFAGDPSRARRLFEEVDGSLETKLRDDLDGGEATFAEWFLHAGWLWRDRGREDRAEWALDAARRAAPRSALPGLLETWWGEIR